MRSARTAQVSSPSQGGPASLTHHGDLGHMQMAINEALQSEHTEQDTKTMYH